jgi:DNA-binding beta-propeller fold protein YncE
MLSIRVCCLAVIFAAQASAQKPSLRTSPADLPGQRKDGSVLLPNQWSLRPVGRQITVGDFPVNIALHPEGRFAAVLHCGYGTHEIVVIDLGANKLVSRTAIHEAFYGIAFSPDGRQLFCSGSADEVLHRFQFEDGALHSHDQLPIRDPGERGIPGGFALAGDTLYVANVWGHAISRLETGAAGNKPVHLPLAVEVREVPKLPPSEDDPSITKRAEALLQKASSPEPFPYACLIDTARGRLYVSLWGQASVAVIDTKEFRLVEKWKVEEHPNEMLLTRDGGHLLVANANRNSVSVVDTSNGRIVETLIAELQPSALPGNTPNSLAFSPDEKRLFVANANINTIAVFDVHEFGKSRSLGFIPVGWYPTSVRVTPDGKKLVVANGKGMISKPNRGGPVPGRSSLPGLTEYIGGLFQGTVTVLDLPREERFEAQLAQWTNRAFQCMPEGVRKMSAESLVGNPVPRATGKPSPIKYVIFIVKENRTYDQVLGDLARGNGDPALCLFPNAVTPNHHAIAEEFVLLDNFYVESEVSADGHEWTFAAYASDFVEKTWPLGYGHSKKFPYPAEGNFPIATPAGGYLWDRAAEAGITYRSYGEFTEDGRTPAEAAVASVPGLAGHIDPWYRGFDMNYPDAKRADRFIGELRRFEKEGEMPRLQIVRLPNDHTSGASPGKPTPIAHVGDNDLALGRVIEAISHSKFWPKTAVFIVEDDAQNGPDHVDAHRTIAFVISPFVKRRSVDSTLYSTSSMLRTIELILGMKPMSQFDAAAMPMFACFQAKPNVAPYTVRPATVDLEQKNPATAWGAEQAKTMNLAKEDAVDDLLLNEMIWRSVRGEPMPAPRRAAFVFTRGDDEDDDDHDADDDARDRGERARARQSR